MMVLRPIKHITSSGLFAEFWLGTVELWPVRMTADGTIITLFASIEVDGVRQAEQRRY